MQRDIRSLSLMLECEKHLKCGFLPYISLLRDRSILLLGWKRNIEICSIRKKENFAESNKYT
jgi:hypothetical protein